MATLLQKVPAAGRKFAGEPETGWRRGRCPGLSAPMPTGDGLLVRMMPIGTVALGALAALCAAARRHGNGIIEVTARGNIQVRGLSDRSAPQFAAAVAAIGIAVAEGIPVLCSPLAGLDPQELLDAGALAADVRRTLARTSLAARLAPKVSVAIDGGGTFNLDGIAADVRLRADPGGRDGEDLLVRISIGGDGASAQQLGFVTAGCGAEAVARLLDLIAEHGRDARARDIVAAAGIAPFAAALTGLLGEPASPGARSDGEPCEPVGAAIALRDGTRAYGVALAFGHADARAIERLAGIAAEAGADGMRVAPERTLLVVGLRPTALSAFAAAAARLGFIVRADDPRRRVVACAGAPVCASAHIAARRLAPLVAAATAPQLGGSRQVHISGCRKGCAHPVSAALTVVGTPDGCALVADGRSRNVPFTLVAVDEVAEAVARHLAASAGVHGDG